MRALILAPFAEECLARLRTHGSVTHESWADSATLHDPESLAARVADERIDVLVVEADFVFGEVFEASDSLRLVGVCRNALNQVDIEAATAHGVAVTHAPGRNTQAVAELTITMMLALGRQLVRAHHLVAGGGWRDPSFGYRHLRGREIAGSTVGVIGFGQIGRQVARLCVALGAHVVAYDPIVPERQVAALGATPASLEHVLGASDFVTLHVPDSEETHHLIGPAAIAKMKPSAFLVNTSSGAAVDPTALTDALERGVIAGAALDVYEGQPLPLSSPLLSAPNVLLTPHIAGATEETIERHSRIITDEIERLLSGQPLQHLVNPDYALARAR